MKEYTKINGQLVEIGAAVGVTAPSLLTMGPPDYSAQETINRISTNGGTWTVDRNGYVKVRNRCTTGSNWIQINDGGLLNGGTDIQNYYFPVRVGDIVKIGNTGGTWLSCECWFVPPVINPPVNLERPLINYSTIEQDTGQTWIDGSKIYQQTFTGKLNIIASGTPYTVNFITGGIKDIVSVNGDIVISATEKHTYPGIWSINGSTVSDMVSVQVVSNNLQFGWITGRTTMPDGSYNLTVRYLKE